MGGYGVAVLVGGADGRVAHDQTYRSQHACQLTAALLGWRRQNRVAKQLESVFMDFGRDLENIKEVYESQKTNPPLPRNAPPVTGNIGPPPCAPQWAARQWGGGVVEVEGCGRRVGYVTFAQEGR